MAHRWAAEPHQHHRQRRNAHVRYPVAWPSRRVPSLYAWIAISVLVTASPAVAHSGTGLQGGFAAGFAHPFSGTDHMLAMVSVGLWGAFLGRPLVTLLPMVFPGVMALGGVLGIAGVPVPPVELGIALSVLVLGSLILGAVRLPVWPACLVIAVFAIFHGYAHGQELPSAADPVGYSAGFVIATGLLHLLGIGIGAIKGRPGGAMTLRCAGGVVAACGVWFLSSSL